MAIFIIIAGGLIAPAQAATVGDAPCTQTVSSSTGVTVSRVGSDCLITFTQGTVTWTVPAGVTTARVLMIGGGGGSGSGGGGAGGYWDFNPTGLNGNIDVTVGAAGKGSAGAQLRGSVGGTTYFASWSAGGGGGGGRGTEGQRQGGNAPTGFTKIGSGGGASSSTGSTTSRSTGEFQGGARTSSSNNIGGGGGGAEQDGFNNSGTGAGSGGRGVVSNITGANVTYAGGGAGVGGTEVAESSNYGGGGRCCSIDGKNGVVFVRYTPTLSTPTTPTANPTAGTLKSIAVSWTAVSNASSYTLKLYASDGTTLLRTITGLTSTSRTITTSDHALTDGTTYQVSITAIGNGSTFLDSSESTKRSVTTSQTLANPSLSSALPTSATLKSINLSWSAIANATSYTIRIYGANDYLLTTRTNISGTSKTITTSDYASLADSTLYKFSIEAIGNNTSFLSSSESAKISATTHAPVSVTINRSLANPYSSRQISYTFTFSEAVSGFTTSNITLSGTSTGWSKGTLSGSGSTYSMTITNSSPIDGTINLSLSNSGIAAVSSSVQSPATNATAFNLGRAAQVTTWIKFLWGEDLVRF